jgi:hypothetical protein
MTEPAPFEVAQEPVVEDVYASMVEFFDLCLSHIMARSKRQVWCSHWQEHEEAVVVIRALWRTWEAAQLNPIDGMAVWMRDFCYPLLLDRLCDPQGTFNGCDWSEDQHMPTSVPLSRHQ